MRSYSFRDTRESVQPCFIQAGESRSKGVRKGGFGVEPPLSLICYKTFIACAMEIIYVLLYFRLFVVNSTHVPPNEFA